MADDDTEIKSDEEEEFVSDQASSEIIEDENQVVNSKPDFTELTKQSLKKLQKWNDESFLYAFDRQLISFGIRLLLFLPGFAILAFFGAWAYASKSPDWWINFIEPTISLSFATILVALVFTIQLGYIIAMTIHRHRVNLSIKNFDIEVKKAQSQHLSITSLHGYEPLEEKIKGSASKHFFLPNVCFICDSNNFRDCLLRNSERYGQKLACSIFFVHSSFTWSTHHD